MEYRSVCLHCLRGLERDGLVKRTVYPVVPPHVEYELTPLGHSLTEPVIALGQWAQQHIADIDAARAAFDAAQEKPITLETLNVTAKDSYHKIV